MFAQKEIIIAEAAKYRTTDRLASFLLSTDTVVATPYQKDHPGQFKSAVKTEDLLKKVIIEGLTGLRI